LTQRRILRSMDTVADAVRFQEVDDLLDGLPSLVLPRMDRDAEPRLLRALHERRVVLVVEVRVRGPGDVDADDTAPLIGDRLLDDDLVERVAERAVGAEDETC